MKWKALGKTLLFPHIAVLLLLLPAGSFFLVKSMLFRPENDPVRIFSYVFAFYVLMIWCIRIPGWIRLIQTFKNTNPYWKLWFGDLRLRMNVTLAGTVLWNSAYAALQLFLGIQDQSAWFYSLAAYYFLLAMMRFFLMRYSMKHKPGENMSAELRRYRGCGFVFLLMNLALSAMIFYMIRENRMVRHHEIVTISMAAYTFASLTAAIVNVLKYRTCGSPVFSASKVISLAAACVSMLTLESTMLATFRDDTMTLQAQRLFLMLSGAAVSAAIIVMAAYMIHTADRKRKDLENEHE